MHIREISLNYQTIQKLPNRANVYHHEVRSPATTAEYYAIMSHASFVIVINVPRAWNKHLEPELWRLRNETQRDPQSTRFCITYKNQLATGSGFKTGPSYYTLSRKFMISIQ